ncbi:Pleiotropic drug resistance protein 1 [Platanthera guangdongensis]|uniref:Pleiotropic drug resistance protein 1 n=1 Tax=Platanthera guangdongensis TaxID=2320717 RepID=A0ABR2LS20_9ASPA
MGDGYDASIRSLSKSRSLWGGRAAQDNTFSGPLQERSDDDEEALVWAALERLPTYDRVQKGILSVADRNVLREIDVKSLTLQERRSLLERLIKVAEEDHERFLLKLKDRIARVGINFPTTELRFEDLNIEAEAYVGSRSLPSFFNAILNNVEVVFWSRHKIKR